LIVTLEENSLRGGFGQAIADYLSTAGYDGKLKTIGIPDTFVTQGTRSELFREIGLDAKSISETIKNLVYDEHKTAAGLLQKLVFRKNGAAKKKTDTGKIKHFVEDS